jgi:type VI secretion system secreted protein Hcp
MGRPAAVRGLAEARVRARAAGHTKSVIGLHTGAPEGAWADMNSRLLICGVLFLSGLCVAAGAAGEFFVTVEGTKQGYFAGEGLRGSELGKIEAIALRYEVTSPRDGASGLATGKRQHSPVTITKEWGRSSPQLFQALATNEVLKSVLLEFVRVGNDGAEEVYQTMKLTNATVSRLARYITPAGVSAGEASRALEDVAFNFEKIEITDLVSRTVAVDDWGTSVVTGASAEPAAGGGLGATATGLLLDRVAPGLGGAAAPAAGLLGGGATGQTATGLLLNKVAPGLGGAAAPAKPNTALKDAILDQVLPKLAPLKP